MACYDDKQRKPQKEEDITKVKWVHINKADAELADSYHTIRNIYAKFLKKRAKRLNTKKEEPRFEHKNLIVEEAHV
jgi:hypothetical protein